jgi:hypothetical protein
LHAINDLWSDVARRLGVPVERGGDAYVHWDGGTLHIAEDRELDADDSLAQLVLHELCHSLVQGPENFRTSDWGLDNTSDRDDERERACLRLQAHLTGAHGLRGLLYPTTVVRPFFESLGDDAFAPVEQESSRLARAAAERASRSEWKPLLDSALARTAELAAVPTHPKSGFALRPQQGSDETCGACVWRSSGGVCRQATRRVFVAASAPTCVRFAPALACQECGACCRAAYDAVEVGARDPVVALHPSLIVREPGRLRLIRTDDRCVALTGDGPYACKIYTDRPRTCREFELGGRHCLSARRRLGLS